MDPPRPPALRPDRPQRADAAGRRGDARLSLRMAIDARAGLPFDPDHVGGQALHSLFRFGFTDDRGVDLSSSSCCVASARLMS